MENSNNYSSTDSTSNRVNESLDVRPLRSSDSNTSYNREELVAALGFIDAEPYDQWICVGMALHTIGNDGLEIWVQWSSTAPNFDEGACHNRWDTFGRQNDQNQVGLGTIFFLAQEAGWRRQSAGTREQNQTIGSQENLSDKGNATRLVRYHGENLHYVVEYKKWFIWDQTRWLEDTHGMLMQLAKQATEKIIDEARELSDDLRQRQIIHALRSENVNRLKAMVELAQTEPRVAISQCLLDRDIYKLNLINGTLNLRKGLLQPHCKEDLITRRVEIELPGLEVNCPTWISFLNRVFDNNKDLIQFMQKIFGYCLTGDTREQCLFFLYGTGANGKSTLLNILETLLNDYTMRISAESLMVKPNATGPTPELARLRGARVVITAEVEDGHRLAENTIKQITGQDTILARNLYANPFEFKPEFKLLIAGNHRPVIRGTDHAIWRRIHMIPFLVTIPTDEQDKELESKLRKELPGILHWALKGCRLWQQVGLTPPQEVQVATEEYRTEMDTTGQWLNECCEPDPEAEERARRLYSSYSLWCKENGFYPLSSKRLGMTLKERGFISKKTPHATWQGIKVTNWGG